MKTHHQESEAAARFASSVKKQKEGNAGAQLTLFFLFIMEHNPLNAAAYSGQVVPFKGLFKISKIHIIPHITILYKPKL